METEHLSDVAYQIELLEQTVRERGVADYEALRDAASQLYENDNGVPWDGKDATVFYPYMEIALFMMHRLVISPAKEYRL